jgi:hypothetical protein
MSSFSVLTLFVASPLIFTFQATRKKTFFCINLYVESKRCIVHETNDKKKQRDERNEDKYNKKLCEEKCKDNKEKRERGNEHKKIKEQGSKNKIISGAADPSGPWPPHN